MRLYIHNAVVLLPMGDTPDPILTVQGAAALQREAKGKDPAATHYFGVATIRCSLSAWAPHNDVRAICAVQAKSTETQSEVARLRMQVSQLQSALHDEQHSRRLLDHPHTAQQGSLQVQRPVSLLAC